jgi:dolichol-phosphate mannosyltransferase
MKLVVIIPTYNERENIITLLTDLHEALKTVRGYSISYLVVDDNSPDGTGAAVAAYQKRYNDVSILTGQKQGLGKALLRGMTYAVDTLGAEVLLQMDADLSHDPKIVPQFLHAIDEGYTFVVGSRYIKGGSIPENWGIHRKIYSVMGNSIVRFGLGHLGVRDWTGGFRAYTRRFYDEIHTELTKYSGYVFQIAFLHKAIHRGANIVEVPFHFTDRLYGRSKIAPAEYIKNIFLYIFESRAYELWNGSFGKFLVVGGIGFGINALLLVMFHNWVHFSASIANLIGAGVAIFSNFNLNNSWTFRHRKISGGKDYLAKLLQFYATSAFGVIVIQTGIIAAGVRFIGDTFYFEYFLIGTALLLIWNYLMYSKFIWKKK